jgi:hypothetical protein
MEAIVAGDRARKTGSTNRMSKPQSRFSSWPGCRRSSGSTASVHDAEPRACAAARTGSAAAAEATPRWRASSPEIPAAGWKVAT